MFKIYIFNYSKTIKNSVLIYLGLLNCVYPFILIHTNILKQGFAISFTYLAIYYFLTNKNIFQRILYGLLFSVLSYSCHSSSIIVIILFLISYIASSTINFQPFLLFKKDYIFNYKISIDNNPIIFLFLLVILLSSQVMLYRCWIILFSYFPLPFNYLFLFIRKSIFRK